MRHIIRQRGIGFSSRIPAVERYFLSIPGLTLEQIGENAVEFSSCGKINYGEIRKGLLRLMKEEGHG